MNNKLSKYKKYLAIIISFTVVGVAGLTYYFVTLNKKTSVGTTQPKSEDGNDQFGLGNHQSIYGVEIFPNLSIYDFYSKLKIENGICIITDDFIAAVITKVISETKITDGNIYFTYALSNNRQNLSVSFEWKKDTANAFWKTYNFSLSV